jgi:hypothetical protein
LFLPVLSQASSSLADNITLVQIDTSGAISELENAASKADLKASEGHTNASLGKRLGIMANTMLIFSGIIVLLFSLAAGFTWMTAGGNEEKIGKAKKMLGGAVAGFLIAITSYSIFVIVNRSTGGVTPTIIETVPINSPDPQGACMSCERVIWSIECSCAWTTEANCTGGDSITWYPDSTFADCAAACDDYLTNGENISHCTY